MDVTLIKGNVYIVTTSKPTAGGWINPGKHLLRVGGKKQHGKRAWHLWARCSLYVPLGSNERGYPIQHELGGFGIGSEDITEVVPVQEYTEKNADGCDIHWCRISSAQIAELDPSWVTTKQHDSLENQIIGFLSKTNERAPK